MKTVLRSTIAALALLATTAQADSKAVEAALKTALPTIKPDAINESPIKGVYEVVVGARLFYVSEDGRYLMQGSMVDLKSREDLTEKKLGAARLGALEKLGTDNMIVFKPKIFKHLVYVFTDIDCGYCRKLHNEIAEYNKQGITVEYLAYPRMGLGSKDHRDMVSVWCAADRNQALTRAKEGKPVQAKECQSPVEAQFALGQRLGVTGTPAVYAANGTQLGGYLPPKQMREALDKLAASAGGAK